MTPPEPATDSIPELRRLALGDLDHEMAATRRVLERIPDDRLDWAPHQRSWTLGALGLHLANLVAWQTGMVRDESYDLAAAPPPSASGPATRQEVLDRFDRNVAALRRALDSAGDEELGRDWTLRRGDQVVLSQPRVAALRSLGISHMIHHRGQLTVYLRLLDLPVPGLYGPSADEAIGS